MQAMPATVQAWNTKVRGRKRQRVASGMLPALLLFHACTGVISLCQLCLAIQEDFEGLTNEEDWTVKTSGLSKGCCCELCLIYDARPDVP